MERALQRLGRGYEQRSLMQPTGFNARRSRPMTKPVTDRGKDRVVAKLGRAQARAYSKLMRAQVRVTVYIK